MPRLLSKLPRLTYMQATAAAATNRRRFYNVALRALVYNRCLLPTLNQFAAGTPNILRANAETETRVVGFGWHHTRHVPPPGLAAAVAPTGGFSGPFARYFIEQPTQQQPPGDGGWPGNDDSEKPSNEGQSAQGKGCKRSRQAKCNSDCDESSPQKKGKKSIFTRTKPLNGHLRTYKVLMLPTKEQKAELVRCFAVSRLAYNFANGQVISGKRANTIELRKEWQKHPKPHWVTEQGKAVSTAFQARAIQDLVGAYTSNYAKLRKNPNHTFKVWYRTTKAHHTPTEIIHIEKDYVKKNSTLLRFEAAPPPLQPRRRRAECFAFFGNNLKAVGGIRLQDQPRVIARMVSEGNHLEEEAKILWDKRMDSFHFIYTYVLPILPDPDPTFQTKSVVACDPGCYPFQAWYSPTSGEHGELLSGGGTEELMRRCYAIDKRCAKLARYTGPGRTKKARENHRRRMSKCLRRERRRLTGWVEASHYNAANTLLTSHDLVLQPRLPTAELAITATRNISSKSARAMLTWSHSCFIARLKSATARYAGRYVLEVPEPGTSKTCTHCGMWKAELQPRDKVYVCNHCGVHVDRQLAGARNNFLAAFGAAVGVGWDGNGG